MTTKTRAPSASTTTSTAGDAQQPSTQQLRQTIEEIAGYANQAFDEIAAVARLALLALETPNGQRNTEPLAHAFSVICSLAQDMQNTIDYTAEAIDCGYTDHMALRRIKAWGDARNGGAA
ncbi:hypothetical protein [Brachymonas denitrificans]|uniref:hypothetical protein n=1 Tax=Brachymonas denitrificans TaxID=28220 RepID=UPI002AFFCBF0|nr:hypothetical protein [Brachymonas denitrificans]